MKKSDKGLWHRWEKETEKLSKAFSRLPDKAFKFAPKTMKMNQLEKLKVRNVDEVRVRIPMHLHNRLEAKVVTENKTRSKVIREALEKAL